MDTLIVSVGNEKWTKKTHVCQRKRKLSVSKRNRIQWCQSHPSPQDIVDFYVFSYVPALFGSLALVLARISRSQSVGRPSVDLSMFVTIVRSLIRSFLGEGPFSPEFVLHYVFLISSVCAARSGVVGEIKPGSRRRKKEAVMWWNLSRHPYRVARCKFSPSNFKNRNVSNVLYDLILRKLPQRISEFGESEQTRTYRTLIANLPESWLS